MVFVTGGTGLLGTHVLLELLSRGEKIRALKRKNADLQQVLNVFRFYLKDKADAEFEKIQWVEGDVLDIISLEDGISGCSQVYHCAAKVSFAKRDFNQMWRINKIGTSNVVNVCLGSGVKQLCYISSTAAIGYNRNKELQTEKNKWKSDPERSNYAVTKYAAELEVWRGIEEGLNAVILNPSVILGPGNWNDSSVAIFKVVKKGLKFYTPGMNAFVDARDVATIAVELAERKISGERYLVISENVFFKDLFYMMAKAFDVKPPSVMVRPWMASLAWKVEGLLHFFFRRKQNITRETAKSSMSVVKYSNEKIIKELNFEFIPVENSVNNAVNFFVNKDLIN